MVSHKGFYSDITMVGTICEETTSAFPPTRWKGTYHRILENDLYECLYDIRSDAPETDKFPALQRCKAKIVWLPDARRAPILFETTDHDSLESEELSLYHVLKVLRRMEMGMTQQVQDCQGYNITRPSEVRNAMITHLRQKFSPIHEGDNSHDTVHTASWNNEWCSNAWPTYLKRKRSVMHCEQAPDTDHRT